MIEKSFDITFFANLALREKQIQQNYRPVIAVHKWFARRPGTLFRGLLLAEFRQGDVKDLFYKSNNLAGITVVDPFMGGGTPVLEANRLGCNVIGGDINPMACWVVEREIAYLNLDDYRRTADKLLEHLRKQVGGYYKTKCILCGNEQAPVKYFLWVKTLKCEWCGQGFDLFPGYTLATNTRHPRYVLLCPICGELNEVDNPREPGVCKACAGLLKAKGPAARNRCACPFCRKLNQYPQANLGPPVHRMVALEYHCPQCKPQHRGRFFKKPDDQDLLLFNITKYKWQHTNAVYVPMEDIPAGDESTRLHRWGYRKYNELFNPRQLLGLELSCRFISALPDSEVKLALATNLSDLLRYQNMLCRYDTRALKSLDVFSVHGFPVSLIQCESNLLGNIDPNRRISIGSGGWTNIIDKYYKAKAYCQQPFEIKHDQGRKTQVAIPGEWLGTNNPDKPGAGKKTVRLHCGSSTELELPAGTLDGIFTDPPYFGNVQYAELMDFCYVWLRQLAGTAMPGVDRISTRNDNELTGNSNMDRGLHHFSAGLSQVFSNMARALKSGAPFVFTYHHNDITAYIPVAIALLDAGLVCSATLPCPGEMGASIHINGTGSSIIDTVFVCRSTGVVPRHTIVSTTTGIASLVLADLKKLQAGGVRCSQGDIRCISYGHLVRMAVWNLRHHWKADASTGTKINTVTNELDRLGGWPAVKTYLSDKVTAPVKQSWLALDQSVEYGRDQNEIAF